MLRRFPTLLTRSMAALLLTAYLPACMTWRVVQPSPAEFIRSETPDNVRITRTDSSVVMLDAPRVRGDSIFGVIGGGIGRGDTLHRTALALSDVRSVEIRRLSVGKTLLLVGGVVGGAIAVTAINCAGSGNSYYC